MENHFSCWMEKCSPPAPPSSFPIPIALKLAIAMLAQHNGVLIRTSEPTQLASINFCSSYVSCEHHQSIHGLAHLSIVGSPHF